MSALDFTKPITTRDGRPVEIISVKGRGSKTVIGYIGDQTYASWWYANGAARDGAGCEDGHDLIQAPPWKLPDPPAGKQWHRKDGWTQGMLPEGWRPMSLKEVPQLGDLFLSAYTHGWEQAGVDPRHGTHYHTRTRRPFPPERKTVPLEAGDVPPGSVFAYFDTPPHCFHSVMRLVTNGVHLMDSDGVTRLRDWVSLKDCKVRVLRPGETEWKPCHKPSEIND